MKKMEIQKKDRRTFLKNTAAVTVLSALSNTPSIARELSGAIPAKGYAAYKAGGDLSSWSFERRAVGEYDVLIDIKFCGVCHSDIHTVRDEWGPQRYPLIPGHEIAGIVTAVGSKVTKFKVGDKAGVGCMVDSCGTCDSCHNGLEQHCNNHQTLWTYGAPDNVMGGITQGGYSNKIVVTEKFAIKIPAALALKDAAPLLCAGITTFSPLMLNKIGKGTKVGVAGIGGLGHLAIKIASALGAEVYAFTTSASKRADILSFGAKEAIVVENSAVLRAWAGKMDYMISTIPAKFDLGAYVSLVKPYGHFTQIGIPAGEFSFNNFSFVNSRVYYTGSLIGGIPQTQETIDFCAAKGIIPNVELVAMKDVNAIFNKVVNKEARYRYVLDLATI